MKKKKGRKSEMENRGGYPVNHVALELPGHLSPWTCFHGWWGVTTNGEVGAGVEMWGLGWRNREDADAGRIKQ